MGNGNRRHIGQGRNWKDLVTGGVASCWRRRQTGACIDMDIGLRNLDISWHDRSGPDGLLPTYWRAAALERAAGTSGHPKLLPLTAPVSPPPPPVGREFHAGCCRPGND